MSLPEEPSPSLAAGLRPPWGPHTIAGDETLPIKVGPLRLWFRFRNGEVWIAGAPKEAGVREVVESPGDEHWGRWAAGENARTVRLVPVFPDRPIVVEPELNFRLLRQAEARVYVRVALWVRVEVGDTGVTLLEIPTIRMSDTWFGGFIDGELCYWLPTTARRQIGPEHFEPHLAVCPLQLANHSAGELNVEKITLRVPHLSIFARDGGGFWADVARVRYEGDELGSSIDMTGEPPSDALAATLVTRPRIPIQRNFRTRTFARLKAISGLGTTY